MIRDQGNVLAAIAQRRQRDRDHVDPVEEILAEPPFGDEPGEILIGGGDHPDVGLQLLEAADAAEAPLLQHAEQLHLHHGAHLADLIQEDRPALGDLEQPLLVRVGAR